MAIFGDFFVSCIFSEPRVEVWQTSNLWPLRLGEEKKERTNHSMKIYMVCSIP